jgi:hypothetical protein
VLKPLIETAKDKVLASRPINNVAVREPNRRVISRILSAGQLCGGAWLPECTSLKRAELCARRRLPAFNDCRRGLPGAEPAKRALAPAARKG